MFSSIGQLVIHTWWTLSLVISLWLKLDFLQSRTVETQTFFSHTGNPHLQPITPRNHCSMNRWGTHYSTGIIPPPPPLFSTTLTNGRHIFDCKACNIAESMRQNSAKVEMAIKWINTVGKCQITSCRSSVLTFQGPYLSPESLVVLLGFVFLRFK